jgi:hypothetical protein
MPRTTYKIRDAAVVQTQPTCRHTECTIPYHTPLTSVEAALHCTALHCTALQVIEYLRIAAKRGVRNLLLIEGTAAGSTLGMSVAYNIARNMNHNVSHAPCSVVACCMPQAACAKRPAARNQARCSVQDPTRSTQHAARNMPARNMQHATCQHGGS